MATLETGVGRVPVDFPILLGPSDGNRGVLGAILGCDSVGIAVTDRSFRYVMWNTFMEDFTGLRADDVLGRNALEVYPHLREEGLERALLRVLAGETVTAPDAPYRIPAAGRRGWVSAQYAPHRSPQGEVLGVVGVLTDVTERKRAEDESRRLAAIPRESPSPVLECEPSGAIRYANPAAVRLADELGVTLEGGLLPAGHRVLTAWAARYGRARTGVETQAAGRVFAWAYHPQPAMGVVHLFGEDATARREAEALLRHQAGHDPLTGLPNRALFLERLARAVHRARPGGEAAAVLFLDLDRFKVVNDSLGHHVGDELLIAVADRLRGCVRDGDVVARLGGDEFVVLLEGVDDVAEASRTAERIHTSLESPLVAGGYSLFTTASIGIAAAAGAAQAEPLLRNADVAMYRAKALGPARSVVYDGAMHAAVSERLRLETELRGAVEQGELMLVYQPVIEIGSGRLTSLEALIRWMHPRRGCIHPGEFVPLAEETGLILDVGRWSLDRACAQIAAWGERSVPVAVNLSGVQLSSPGLVADVAAALERHAVPAERLRLEVTEGAVVRSIEAAGLTLSGLRAMGVQIYLDDFGTGYSSLAYLSRLPVDALKVDRAFVTALGTDPAALRMARLVVNVAHDLGLSVVAEGVERPEQLEALRGLGCRYAQGFLLGMPMTPAAVTRLLRARPKRPARRPFARAG